MITLLQGDARELLQTLADKSVQCIVNSPPYYGLRKYSDDPREIGNESTPAEYVQALVAVFAECWRVLRDDGVMWLNLGDSYANDTKWGGKTTGKHAGGLQGTTYIGRNRTQTGLPSKSLIGLPWRVAFALQDAGWILRSDIIWSKPNAMPESVTDRPTRAHEYLFLFAKRAQYFYDAAAIAEQGSSNSHGGKLQKDITTARKINSLQDVNSSTLGGVAADYNESGTRNKRTVWTIATQPYSEVHFATMPEALIEPCILAGSSAQACETCGAAWGRVTEYGKVLSTGGSDKGMRAQNMEAYDPSGKHTVANAYNTGNMVQREKITMGFAPRCTCPANTGSARSVVLDPFGGSGTVAKVAERYQRNAILIDLNHAYIDLQEKRTDKVQIEMFV